MFPESHGFVVMPVTSSNNFVCISLIKYGQIGTCMFDTACERYNNETTTLRKYVTKYKNMRKWMVEFFAISGRREIYLKNFLERGDVE